MDSKNNTAKIEFLIPASLPSSAVDKVPIGYWPQEILEEARKRGAWPLVRIMWPEELETFLLGKAEQVAVKVAKRQASSDPLLVALAEGIARQMPPAAASFETGSHEVLVKIEEFARRTGYSVRFVRKLILRGLPTLGTGKARRVHLAKATEWLEQNLDTLELPDDADLDELAVANARALKRQAR